LAVNRDPAAGSADPAGQGRHFKASGKNNSDGLEYACRYLFDELGRYLPMPSEGLVDNRIS
jgi:hypothetical protein